jgi:beta-N-acetylhexosaminidase
MNLAPVLDTVPGPTAAPGNAPIGAFGRQFGYTAAAVADQGLAFARGMAAQGVVPVVKHFPGLGRVSANTDEAAGVTDPRTHRRDPYLRPFREAVRDGARVVMMSSARYPRLDPRGPAVFSRAVISGLLRRDLGHRGLVMSDDLGSAAQVARWSPGERAVKFIDAGGDVVLTVTATPLPAMYSAVLGRARNDPSFRARVDRAALRVLNAKASEGLLGR